MRVRALTWGAAIFAAVSVGADSALPIPVYVSGDQTIFPSEWQKKPIRAQAAPLPDSEVSRSLAAANRAIRKYPTSLLQQNLHGVYFVGELRFYGLPYGGTNSQDMIYIANRGANNGFTDQFLEESFHHEFSSILLRNYARQFDEPSWIACNAPGARYRSNGTEALREGSASTDYQRPYHELGFLAQYATASVEEDFNMMAEGLFSGNPRFWEAVDSYPRLKMKSAHAILFYNKLDSRFTEAWFRSLVR